MSAGTLKRWLGVLAATFGLLSACGGRTVAPPGASGGAEAASGGAEAAGSGGTADASGGAAAEGSGGLLSEEEWQLVTAPVPGPHEIWTYDTCDPAHTGTNAVLVGQEYSVIPKVGTTAGSNVDPESSGVYFAVLMDYCMTAADCTDFPDGVCEGFIEDAYCEYSQPLPADPCWLDEECTRKPEGSCVLPLGPWADTVCYPTGVCVAPTGECIYAGSLPCTGDADCTDAADGRCIFPVDTRCRPALCFEDADCDEG